MNILDKIIAVKQQEIALAKQQFPLAKLEQQLTHITKRDFVAALQQQLAAKQPGIIAEIKKASPSQGIIRDPFDPTAIAQSYAKAGATCLSVLTDEQFFHGSKDYLKQARDACALPILRKDFIIDPYQVFQSKVWQADCILLIVAALNQEQLIILHELACELNLDVLIEVHNQTELERALAIDNPLIGINNRDLTTFKTNLKTTLTLLPNISKDKIVITESGIHSAADVKLMQDHNVNCFLVGESMMRSTDPGGKLRELFF